MAELVDCIREDTWHLSDGIVTLRRPEPIDVDIQLSGVDEEQIRWTWLRGHRESWLALTPEARRSHTEGVLAGWRDAFGQGAVWNFAVDTADHRYVAMIEANLDATDVPAGDANISYCAHPHHRGNGYVSRAVRLVLGFLAERSAAGRAHFLIDPANTASLRVAATIGAEHVGTFTSTDGQRMTRNVIFIGGSPAVH